MSSRVANTAVKAVSRGSSVTSVGSQPGPDVVASVVRRVVVAVWPPEGPLRQRLRSAADVVDTEQHDQIATPISTATSAATIIIDPIATAASAIDHRQARTASRTITHLTTITATMSESVTRRDVPVDPQVRATFTRAITVSISTLKP